MSLEHLWTLVCAIPKGRVATYGEIGAALPNPASGFFVGKWMAGAPQFVPWWRVVAKDGRLPVDKRNPALAMEQRQRLESEGVIFVEGRVDMVACGWSPG